MIEIMVEGWKEGTRRVVYVCRYRTGPFGSNSIDGVMPMWGKRGVEIVGCMVQQRRGQVESIR